MESHGAGGVMETLQTKLTSTERPYALSQAILACRPGGTVSLPGVFVGPAVPAPLGAVVGKGLTLNTGQTHVQRYLEPLLNLIVEGKIDPSFLITHRIGLKRGTGGIQDFSGQSGRLRQSCHPAEWIARGMASSIQFVHAYLTPSGELGFF